MQYSKTTRTRAKLMDDMNNYIWGSCDEKVIQSWQYVFPMNATEDSLLKMAQDDDFWEGVVHMFGRCVRTLGRIS